jgi:putative acetyltransferase
MVSIRRAMSTDRAAIDAVVRAAFESDTEVVLVERIRSGGGLLWERVAEHDGQVVGHVMVSRAKLDGGSEVAMLSPLAVQPDVQRRGIGSELVRDVCAIADAAAEPLVVLQGSPVYYGRLGFVDSRSVGITMDLPDWAPREAGQVLMLAGYDPSVRGHVVEPDAFVDLP